MKNKPPVAPQILVLVFQGCLPHLVESREEAQPAHGLVGKRHLEKVIFGTDL